MNKIDDFLTLSLEELSKMEKISTIYSNIQSQNDDIKRIEHRYQQKIFWIISVFSALIIGSGLLGWLAGQ